MKELSSKCLKTKFNDETVYTFPISVRDVLQIYYVAVRGRDNEEAAVQRVLNRKRISSIKDFILAGNMFFNTFVLNWTDSNYKPQYNEKTGEITIPISPGSAQVIDGQHRIAGLEEALKQDDKVGEKTIIISLCTYLTTKKAASIFLNINYEQKPVPKSLVFDLFGIMEDETEYAINRANDIAQELNENPSSPYYKCIKYPGAPRGVGYIDLSTVVSSLKKELEPSGTFEHYNLESLNYQKQVLMNYFTAIRYFYDKTDLWSNKAKNPFLQSSGFYGAIEFLVKKLLPKCVDKKSFSLETFKELLSLDQSSLLLKDELKGLDGKTARKKIVEFLEFNINKGVPAQDEYEF